MIFPGTPNATFEFTLDTDRGQPRLMCHGNDGRWYRVWISRPDAIAAAKLLLDAAEAMPVEARGTLHCSFCGKSQYDVRKLVAGPDIFICNECIGFCVEIIKDDAPNA